VAKFDLRFVESVGRSGGIAWGLDEFEKRVNPPVSGTVLFQRSVATRIPAVKRHVEDEGHRKETLSDVEMSAQCCPPAASVVEEVLEAALRFPRPRLHHGTSLFAAAHFLIHREGRRGRFVAS
jgi:hypothetical protein